VKLTHGLDGTIHVEGTPEEVRELLALPKDAVGKMLVQYPPFAPGCAQPFMGQVWVGEIRPAPFIPAAGATCAAAPQSFLWPPPSNAGALT
jgi:hypothetical protein